MPDVPEHNTVESNNQSQRLLVFECGGQQCALQVDRVQEVIAMAALSTPLGTPTILDGFLNIEGVAIPVINLAVLIGKESDPIHLHTPLVIINTHFGLMAIRVSRVLHIVSVDMRAARPLLDQNVASQSVIIDGSIIAILATDRLLHAREVAVVEELRSLEEDRLAALETEAV